MSYRNPIIRKQSFGNQGKMPQAVIDFKKELDMFFFSESDIVCLNNELNNAAELIISINCNFGLTEGLHHLNSGTWGGFVRDKQYRSRFDKAILALKEKSASEIDISEFVINFSDTSVIITKIYPQSISDCLDIILTTISLNFVHITKALTEMPFEIFVPVFMDEIGGSKLERLHNQTSNSPRSYFDYWGLYFSSNKNNDATIYDVKEKKIIEGDFLSLDF